MHAVLKDAGAELLNLRPVPEANSIASLIRHLTRAQDDHLSEIMKEEL